MNESDFDLRIERVRKAAEVISALPSETLQAEALKYLLGEATGTTSAAEPAKAEADGHGPDSKKGEKSETGEKKNRRSAPKVAISWDRELELFPEGKTSFEDFALNKAPTNHEEKYAVAVFWLREIAEVGGATVGQVMACYRAADWSLPSNSANQASQAVKKGYLSSGKSEELQLSSIGINLVEKTLPRSKS